MLFVVLGVVVLRNRSCVMTSYDLLRNVSDRCSLLVILIEPRCSKQSSWF